MRFQNEDPQMERELTGSRGTVREIGKEDIRIWTPNSKGRSTHALGSKGAPTGRPLNSPHGEEQGVEQNRHVHEEISIADIVEVVLDILVNQEPAVRAQLP